MICACTPRHPCWIPCHEWLMALLDAVLAEQDHGYLDDLAPDLTRQALAGGLTELADRHPYRSGGR